MLNHSGFERRARNNLILLILISTFIPLSGAQENTTQTGTDLQVYECRGLLTIDNPAKALRGYRLIEARSRDPREGFNLKVLSNSLPGQPGQSLLISTYSLGSSDPALEHLGKIPGNMKNETGFGVLAPDTQVTITPMGCNILGYNLLTPQVGPQGTSPSDSMGTGEHRSPAEISVKDEPESETRSDSSGEPGEKKKDSSNPGI